MAERLTLVFVMRGLVPRIDPWRRRDGVWAPEWVGPRNEPAGDEWRVGS
jgi:hypothetical protein